MFRLMSVTTERLSESGLTATSVSLQLYSVVLIHVELCSLLGKVNNPSISPGRRHQSCNLLLITTGFYSLCWPSPHLVLNLTYNSIYLHLTVRNIYPTNDTNHFIVSFWWLMLRLPKMKHSNISLQFEALSFSLFGKREKRIKNIPVEIIPKLFIYIYIYIFIRNNHSIRS